MTQIISTISGDIDDVVDKIGKLVSDVTLATNQLMHITSSFTPKPKLEALASSFKVTQSDPNDINTAIKRAMKAAHQQANSIFKETWPSIIISGSDSGVVQNYKNYVPGKSISCVTEQMTQDFKDWGIETHSNVIQMMAKTIAGEIKAQMGVPGSAQGIHSINMNQQINWIVTYGIFILGNDQQGLVYGFAAALDSDFSFKQEMTHGPQLTREHLKEIKTSVEKSLNKQPISLTIQLGEKQDGPTIAIGDITTPNPTLWVYLDPLGQEDPTYEISTFPPGEDWHYVNLFCSILSVEWLKARASGKNPKKFGLQQFDDHEKIRMARLLLAFNATSDGLKAQERYAENELGGQTTLERDVTGGMKGNTDPYPQGTQIWAGSDTHVVAYYITSDKEYQYYDSNSGDIKPRERSNFQNENEANTFVVAKKK